MPKRIRRRIEEKEDYEPGNYVVKDLIGYRNNKGVEEFLVWWEGYGRDESTWETKDNITGVEKDGWDETFESCKQHALRALKVPKTKQIYSQIKSERQLREEKAIYEAKLQYKMNKLADFLVRQKDNLLSIFEEKQKVSQQKMEEEHKFIEQPPEIKEQQQKAIGFRPPNILIQNEQLEQVQNHSKEDNCIFSELKVKGIKKRYFLKDEEILYEMDIQKGPYCYPLLFHEHYVKKLWPEHLKQFDAFFNNVELITQYLE